MFSFGEDSIRFQCRYSRSVSVTQDMSIIDTPTDAVEGTGNLSYTMSIDVGGPGGTTEVTISPNHNFDEVAPRSAFEKSYICHNLWLTINDTWLAAGNLSYHECFRILNCNVAHAEHKLYPIHSFDDDQLCFDKSRKDISFKTKSQFWRVRSKVDGLKRWKFAFLKVDGASNLNGLDSN